MPHTRGHYRQDRGFADGVIMYPANAFDVYSAAATDAVRTRNAAGDISINQIPAKTNQYVVALSEGQVLRVGEVETFSNQFGGTGIFGDATPQEPLTGMGTLQQLTPRTGPKVKGIKFLSIAVAYMIGVVNLTTFTCRLDKLNWTAGAAPAVTNLLASGANGLAVAFDNVNMQVIEIPLGTGLQIYQVSDLAQILLELSVTTAATGTFRLYGVRAKVEFNFN